MAKLEDLKRGASVKGILPDYLVAVIDVKWHGSAAIELTDKDPAGKPNVLLLYRDPEPPLEIGEIGRPWLQQPGAGMAVASVRGIRINRSTELR